MAKSNTNSIKPTQRAYTLRLRGIPGDTEWKDRLWKTHVAVNNGAKVFGDWLLTLRGGLSHELAYMKIPGAKGKPDRDPTEKEISDRRIVLALSWLSVESENGAPVKFIVSHDHDEKSKKRIKWLTIQTLKEILKKRDLKDSEIDGWVNDCEASLTAAIREDAVWVNRSALFDYAITRPGLSATRNDIWNLLQMVFSGKEEYLAPEMSDDEQEKPIEGSEETSEKKAPAKSDSKDFAIKARGWLSQNWGSGPKSDKAQIAENLKKLSEVLASPDLSCTSGKDLVVHMVKSLGCNLSEQDEPLKDLKKAIGWKSGRESTGAMALKKTHEYENITPVELNYLISKFEKEIEDKSTDSELKTEIPEWASAFREIIETEIGIKYRTNRDLIGEFSVMLDHAARRVSSGHSWIKIAEASRRGFDKESERKAYVPEQTWMWLESFRNERGDKSGAAEEYLIRKKAIGGWKEVVGAWSQTGCLTDEDRVVAARALQDSQEIDKFGDIQLFEALAVEDAKCVWITNGKPDPEPLANYVAATMAEFNKKRFKVPAYRHPDPLLHPVFCDFGDSRWSVEYELHKKQKNESSAKSKKGISTTENLNTVSMGLFDGADITDTKLHWMSKLLIKDLGINQEPNHENDKVAGVSRNSRLGRAATATGELQNVRILNVFEEKHWNARLQAPRKQLEDIARYLTKTGGTWDDKAKKMRDNIKWLISFSPRVQPAGPWVEYAKSNGLNILPKYYKHPDSDPKRKSGARHLFSRLPGLRVLSVDLGHRYAAACAVWESITKEEMEKLCAEYNHPAPKPDDLFIHLKKKTVKTKEGKTKEIEETTIYRRTGADTLPDGAPHPAPWARLDRQFLVKLQGEDEKPRKSSDAERAFVSEFEKEIGHKSPDKQIKRVDELMSYAVDTARLGIRRHADLARISHNLITNEKLLPGGRQEPLTPEKRIDLLTDTLLVWYMLMKNKRWDCLKADELWKEHIENLFFAENIPLEFGEDESLTAPERKKQREELKNQLKPIAEILSGNEPARTQISQCWQDFWNEEDVKWKERLKKLRDWILPRGIYGYEKSESGATRRVLKDKKKLDAARHVGGLSLTRIATIKSLYQVQKAFKMRPEPDNPRKNIPAEGDDRLKNFGRRILDDMEQLRENRVKQLASRIAEAALGIGRMEINKKKTKGETTRPRDPKRPRERKDAPCHAVVIENLEHYRPEEIRTRRENRQLMSWSSAKVFKYLSEACELHGLHLRQVPASYTSRQDSRTGAPGVRCTDVPIKDFISDSSYWHREIARADKRVKEKKHDAHDEFILDIFNYWKTNYNEKEHIHRSVRIPRNGGEIFVSADENSPAASGLQADLNAAANIGLRALLDPDWQGKWWYIPCESATLKPAKDKVGGCDAIDTTKPLKSLTDPDTDKKTGRRGSGKSKEIVNLWCDVSTSDIDHTRNWFTYHEYKEDVLMRVIENLKEHNK